MKDILSFDLWLQQLEDLLQKNEITLSSKLRHEVRHLTHEAYKQWSIANLELCIENSDMIAELQAANEELLAINNELINVNTQLEEERRQFLAILDSIPELIYVSDMDSYEILFANKKMKELFGKDITGLICFEAIQHKNEACDFCTNRFIRETEEPYFWEYFNPVLQRHFYVMDRKIRWTSKKEVRFELATDITAFKKTGLENKKLSAIVEQSPESIVITDLDGKIEYVNPAFEFQTGYSQAEVLGKNPRILQSGKTEAETYHSLWSSLNKGDTWKGNFINRRKDGREMIEKAVVFPLFDEQNRKTHIIAIKEDITAQVLNEQKIHQSEEKYRLIAENASDVIWILNLAKQKFTYISPSVFLLRGFTPQEAIAQSLDEALTPESAKVVVDSINEILPVFFTNPAEESKKIYRHELRQGCKDGSVIWIETSTRYQLNAENEVEVIGISRNIEERKQFEQKLAVEAQQLKEALDSKEILLKEVHHRVKNNLQTISSLLYQQQVLSKDPKVADALRDGMNRVSSMALIHQFIYKSEDLKNIGMREYIRDLVGKLVATYNQKKKKIEIRLDIEDIYFDIDKTIPVALIINEVLSNIYKYAFLDKESGIIDIQLKNLHENKCRLFIADNGIGFPQDFVPENSKSLGFYLIHNLGKRQLHGEWEINSIPGEGVKYSLVF